LAFYLFVVAMLTDIYDGYLARRSNSVTEFGKLMDPLADKVLVSLVLVGFLLMRLPFIATWMVAIIVGRELLILGYRTNAAKSGQGLVTSRLAKLKTAAQMAWVASILLYLTVLSRTGLAPSAEGLSSVELILWCLGSGAVLLTVISGAEYLLRGRALARPGSSVAGTGPGEGG
jgi:CDP-diacylglycerol--glycerol-3-phosphate 3-phosphatidyltransferase